MAGESVMPRLALGLFLASMVVLPMTPAQGAELQIIAGGGAAAAYTEIAELFDRASGHKTVLRFGTAPQLVGMTTGSAFDAAIVPEDVIKDAAARAQFADQPSPIARVGIGVAVRPGSPKPDIGTPEKLKQTLLAAGSIASLPASAIGGQLAAIYEQLGIAEAMKAKTKAAASPPQIAEAVANGEAELAVFALSVLADPRLEIVGPFPREVQREVVYVAGISRNAKQPEAGKAFLDFVRSPAGTAVIKARGLQPG
jgi:molybdate transport system substrate-binding protein